MISKLSLCFLALICSSFSFGQRNANLYASHDFNKFQVSLNASPDYCYHFLEYNYGDEPTLQFIEERNSLEKPKLGFTSGVGISFNLNKKLGFELGFQFARKGYQDKFKDVLISSNSENSLDQIKLIRHFNYFEIPLKINFMIGQNKLKFYSSLGLSASFLQSAKIDWIIRSTKEKYTTFDATDFQKFNLSPLISLGIDYKLNQRLNVRIAPFFSFGILKIHESRMNTFLYNAGLNFGFYYGL